MRKAKERSGFMPYTPLFSRWANPAKIMAVEK
jgi:hypothetical protein